MAKKLEILSKICKTPPLGLEPRTTKLTVLGSTY